VYNAFNGRKSQITLDEYSSLRFKKSCIVIGIGPITGRTIPSEVRFSIQASITGVIPVGKERKARTFWVAKAPSG